MDEKKKLDLKEDSELRQLCTPSTPKHPRAQLLLFMQVQIQSLSIKTELQFKNLGPKLGKALLIRITKQKQLISDLICD